MNNNQKIEQILLKYKDKKFKDIEDFYQEIIYQNYNHECNIHLSTISTRNEKFLNLENNFRKLKKYQNYKIDRVGNVSGISFVAVNNTLYEHEKENISLWGFFSKYARYGGSKLYINIPFYQILQLDKEQIDNINTQVKNAPTNKHREITIEFKNNSYHYAEYRNRNLRRNKLSYNSCDLVITDGDQMLLADYFIMDLFAEIDKNGKDYIDVIALKYFTKEYRDDRVNIYISQKIRNSKSDSLKFVALVNRVIEKYKKRGLTFASNSFIMPYMFDSQRRVIANTYIADSFNKSIIYFLELYRTLDIELCKIFFRYNEIKTDTYGAKEEKIKMIQSYIKKIDKKIEFKDFVQGVFELFSDTHEFDGLSDYRKTYELLFEF